MGRDGCHPRNHERIPPGGTLGPDPRAGPRGEDLNLDIDRNPGDDPPASPVAKSRVRTPGSRPKRALCKGEKAAWQLEGPDVAFFKEGLRAVAGADAEEGKIAAAGEGLEVATGVGNPVDFMEGVGKVGYPRLACAHIS